jgi:hypothetical protein
MKYCQECPYHNYDYSDCWGYSLSCKNEKTDPHKGSIINAKKFQEMMENGEDDLLWKCTSIPDWCPLNESGIISFIKRICKRMFNSLKHIITLSI